MGDAVSDEHGNDEHKAFAEFMNVIHAQLREENERRRAEADARAAQKEKEKRERRKNGR